VFIYSYKENKKTGNLNYTESEKCYYFIGYSQLSFKNDGKAISAPQWKTRENQGNGGIGTAL
jgi:hypothetical protein